MSGFYLIQDEDRDEWFSILDKDDKEVGRVGFLCEGEEVSIMYFSSKVPVTVKMKNDLLKSLKEYCPGVKYLTGLRISRGGKEGSISGRDSEAYLGRSYD